MRILLIRHGRTAGNEERRYVGSTDEALTDGAAEQLLRLRESYPKPEAVYTSPMKRCVQTASILWPELAPSPIPDFREIDFGDWEYKNYEDLKDEPRYQSWIDRGGTGAFPGGESRGAFCDRCCRAFTRVCDAAKHAGFGTIAFVVHGGTIMAVLDRFSKPHRGYFDWQIGNAEGFSCTLESHTLTGIVPLPETPALTGVEDLSVRKQGKELRMGYTTGSCAAAAAQAAALMLFSGRAVHRADLMTPKGVGLHLPVGEQEISEKSARCAVIKYAGDDPDETDGTAVFAKVAYAPEDLSDKAVFRDQRQDGPVLFLAGGEGVGRVTKTGLEQKVGFPAINRVPREMIFAEVRNVCEEFDFGGSLLITISVPDGAALAEKTFNPHLGISGGISILGTSGIVEPMSEEALLTSIKLEIAQKCANGQDLLLITPGNYGMDFIRQDLRAVLPDVDCAVKCSNYVGATLDMAAEASAKAILFVAHIGKFIKLSGGIMNTHSAQADCRAELFAAQAMRVGADPDTVRLVLDSNTTEEAVAILDRAGFLDQTIRQVIDRIQFYLQKRLKGSLQTELILFSSAHGYLGESGGAEKLTERIAAQYAKEREDGPL